MVPIISGADCKSQKTCVKGISSGIGFPTAAITLINGVGTQMEADRIKKRDSGMHFRHSERQVNFSKKHNLFGFVFHHSAGKIPSWQELITALARSAGIWGKDSMDV